MSLFSNIYQKSKRKNQISSLDDEILALIEKKSSIEVEIQKLELKLNSLNEKHEITEKFIDLKTAIGQAETKLRMTSEEIDNESKTLDELKNECSLISECKSYEDMLKKLSTDLQKSTDSMLKRLLDKFPDIESVSLNLIDELKPYGLEISPSSILLVINNLLTEFAIDHLINPEEYINFIYSINSFWFKEFDKIKHLKHISLYDKKYSLLLHAFVALQDT